APSGRPPRSQRRAPPESRIFLPYFSRHISPYNSKILRTMRVLLIHPEDELQAGPWASQRWDRVIDLGRAGASSYQQAAASYGCAVGTLDAFRHNFREKR